MPAPDLRTDLTRLLDLLSDTDGVRRSDREARRTAAVQARLIRGRLDAGLYPAPLRHPVVEVPPKELRN